MLITRSNQCASHSDAIAIPVHLHLSYRGKILGNGSPVSLSSSQAAIRPRLTPRVRSQQNWLHPRYADLLGVFDDHIRDLVIRPTSSDFILESIQGLLLATQWPPLDLDNGKPKSRFNDAYAWLMIGLAIRLAQYIDLEKCVEGSLETDEDMQRMRVWLNLVSVDRQ